METTAAAIEHSLRIRILPDPINAPNDALVQYLVGVMGDLPREQVRVLYLDSSNHLLRVEVAAEGSPNQIFAAPRVILTRALELEATALIVVHNHPGGTPEPSPADHRFTNHLARAARDLGIVFHDHLIVAGDHCRSIVASEMRR